MIVGLLLILACQLAGEAVVAVTGLPVPGPVVGMLLFLLVLALRRPAPDAPESRAAEALLTHLSMLYVPAGVGVITLLALLRAEWLATVGGLVLGWLAALLAAAFTAAVLLRWTRTVATPGNSSAPRSASDPPPGSGSGSGPGSPPGRPG